MSYEKVIERLGRGELVEHKEGGNSMTSLIASRQAVTLALVDTAKLEKGDMVFCKVRGNFYTHLVSAVSGNKVQISNNHGHVNGWTTRQRVYAIVCAIDGRPVRKALSKILKP